MIRDRTMNIGRDASGFQMDLNLSRLVLRIIYRWATKQESMARDDRDTATEQRGQYPPFVRTGGSRPQPFTFPAVRSVSAVISILTGSTSTYADITPAEDRCCGIHTRDCNRRDAVARSYTEGAKR